MPSNNSNPCKAIALRSKALGNIGIPSDVANPIDLDIVKRYQFAMAVFHKPDYSRKLPEGWLRSDFAIDDIEFIRLFANDAASALLNAHKLAIRRNFQRYVVMVNGQVIYCSAFGKALQPSDNHLAMIANLLAAKQPLAPLDRKPNNDGGLLGSSNRTITSTKKLVPGRKRAPKEHTQVISSTGQDRILPAYQADNAILLREQCNLHAHIQGLLAGNRLLSWPSGVILSGSYDARAVKRLDDRREGR